MDEIAAMNAFDRMHENLQQDAHDYDQIVKEYGKNYICSQTHLEIYLSEFNDLIEKDRAEAKKEILDKGMLSNAYVLDAHEEGATEDEICEMAEFLKTTYAIRLKSFAKFRDQKLYYNHEEHCKVQMEYFLELKKK